MPRYLLSRFAAAVMLAAALTQPQGTAHAEENFVKFKILKPELAVELAGAILKACRKSGYQVAVVVVDRFGLIQAAVRDSLVGPQSIEIARRKAWTAAGFKTDTLSLFNQTKPGTGNSGIRQAPGVLMVGGGVPVRSAGSVVAAVGVSGAPGGAADDKCARTGIATIQDKLEF
ncbi:MAG: GlcG/HbpS family heme-binding protein [Alphaproteobacteria bacterium]